jgi:hypothetical protein
MICFFVAIHGRSLVAVVASAKGATELSIFPLQPAVTSEVNQLAQIAMKRTFKRFGRCGHPPFWLTWDRHIYIENCLFSGWCVESFEALEMVGARGTNATGSATGVMKLPGSVALTAVRGRSNSVFNGRVKSPPELLRRFFDKGHFWIYILAGCS